PAVKQPLQPVESNFRPWQVIKAGHAPPIRPELAHEILEIRVPDFLKIDRLTIIGSIRSMCRTCRTKKGHYHRQNQQPYSFHQPSISAFREKQKPKHLAIEAQNQQLGCSAPI